MPRSEEGERLKQEFTGQLIEYDQCRRMAALLRQKAEAAPVFVRPPMEMEFDNTYDLHHAPQVLADYWAVLSGRTKLRREPTQQQFEPLVTAPMVSVTSRVVYILRHLISGTAAKMSQLFSRQQTRSTNVATFLALLELVRGGRVKLDDEGRLIFVEKVRGRRASLKALLQHMEATAIAPETQTIFISHGDCLEEAQLLGQMIRDKLHVQDVVINYVGPVIGAHSGPGTLALFFLGTKR